MKTEHVAFCYLTTTNNILPTTSYQIAHFILTLLDQPTTNHVQFYCKYLLTTPLSHSLAQNNLNFIQGFPDKELSTETAIITFQLKSYLARNFTTYSMPGKLRSFNSPCIILNSEQKRNDITKTIR